MCFFLINNSLLQWLFNNRSLYLNFYSITGSSYLSATIAIITMTYIALIHAYLYHYTMMENIKQSFIHCILFVSPEQVYSARSATKTLCPQRMSPKLMTSSSSRPFWKSSRIVQDLQLLGMFLKNGLSLPRSLSRYVIVYRLLQSLLTIIPMLREDSSPT